MKDQDLIYIYDTEHQKIILIDGETGERVQEKDDEVTSLLKFLDKKEQPQLLRSFAVWCARQINNKPKPIRKKMLDLADKAIGEATDPKALAELYRETEGTAVAADTVGLRKGSESAPAYLAARECINPDALDGAIQAARFHRLWAEMLEQKNEFSDEALQEISTDPGQKIIEKITKKQTNRLLDLMNRQGQK